MRYLTRILVFAGSIGSAVAFLVGLEGEDLDATWRFLAIPAVAWGMIAASLVVGACAAWPGIRWICQYPSRMRQSRLKEAIRLFKMATLQEEEFELAILADGGVRMETRATIARAKLSKMGLGLPESEDPNHLAWDYHAAKMIPYIEEYGIGEARRVCKSGDFG